MRRVVGTGVVPSTGRRLPGIEGLRAVAALSILVVHTWGEAGPDGAPDLGRIGRHFPDLSFGVTLFFALSGFLLYRPFANALLRGDARPSFRSYIRNRALRILPAYWVILVVCALVLQEANVRGDGGTLEHHALTDPGLLLRAALLVQDYEPGTILTGIGPAWSLAVEVVFYLVLPLLVVVAWRIGADAVTLRRRVAAALAPAAVVLAIGLVGKGVAAYVIPAPVDEGFNTDWHSVVERSFLCQADLFTFGLALAVLYSLWRQARFRLPKHWRIVALGFCAGSYALTARISWTEYQLSYSFYNTLIALVVGLLLALVVFPPERGPALLLRVLETRVLVAGGIISYSVFLWHEPVILALHDHGLTLDGAGGFLVNVALVVVITAVLSTLSWWLVEAPALRFKTSMSRDRTRPEPPPASQVEAAP
jgi:peptidoglycan/LPS O-acetylase OafA/YrhL